MRYRAIVSALLALCLCVLSACSSEPDLSDRANLSYMEMKDTGLAGYCPTMDETARGSISLDAGQSYRITELCLQPNDYFVKEEPKSARKEAEFVAAKSLTRYTSSIEQVSGDLILNGDGSLTFAEKDGMDFQAITVQLPGGEQVPFLFTIKNLVANSQPGLNSVNTSTNLEGDYKVPSYRGASFLDPKGRGTATGYDNAVALPASADEEEFERANVKRTDTQEGHIALNVTQVDPYTGEIAGIFESEQDSATDLGAHDSLEVKVRGVFYGRVEPTA